MKIKKSFANASAKPVDVQYRLKRAFETAEEALMFISSIDPSALPEGTIDTLAQAAVQLSVLVQAAQGMAPEKRGSKKPKAEPTAEDEEERRAIQEEGAAMAAE